MNLKYCLVNQRAIFNITIEEKKGRESHRRNSVENCRDFFFKSIEKHTNLSNKSQNCTCEFHDVTLKDFYSR